MHFNAEIVAHSMLRARALTQPITNQVGAVDLTRSISQAGSTQTASTNASTASEKAAAAKKLAFSVENILDPTKFCSRQDGRVGWPDGFDGADRMDDDHSDSHSGEKSMYI